MNPTLAECIPFLLAALAFAVLVACLASIHDRGVRAEQDRLDAEFVARMKADHERHRAKFAARRSA